MNATPAPADSLRTALDTALDGIPPRRVAQAVERLMTQYRGGGTPGAGPVLRDRADVVAYAAYRMPATFAAMHAALAALARAMPAGWTPGHHVDLGGGTGAAAWAVSTVWADQRPVTVLDRAEAALALGRELAAARPALSRARWHTARFGAAPTDPVPDLAAATGPAPDPAALATLGYVLGELTAQEQAAVVAAAARAAGAVVVVEPGTPDGYARVIAARTALTDAGLRIAAPCPHSAGCPVAPGADWCHFSVRVSRSPLHRQVKGGSLGYEDEKFAYVAAVHPAVAPVRPAAARVLRRPQFRKGHVLLDLCGVDGTWARTTVTRRQGTAYRAARAAAWGDPWEEPPRGAPESPGPA